MDVALKFNDAEWPYRRMIDHKMDLACCISPLIGLRRKQNVIGHVGEAEESFLHVPLLLVVVVKIVGD